MPRMIPWRGAALAALSALLPLAVHAAAVDRPAPAGPLSLTEILARAAAADPTASASSARVEAAEADRLQAGFRPNPVVSGEIENFATTGGLLNRTEATVFYEQKVERGGKRAARVDVAEARREVARRRGEVRRLDWLRDVQVAYAEALAAEVQVLVVRSRLAAEQAAERDIARRVRTARDPLFAGARIETQVKDAEVALDRAEANARAARAALSAYWGGGGAFTLDPTAFFEARLSAAPEQAEGPDLALLAAERDAAAAAVRVEQAEAVPDRTVRAGVRYLATGNDLAVVVGGSMPLQRYDRNQGGVARAQAERTAAEVEIAAARLARQRDAARLVARMSAAAREADRVAAEVIPAAQKTVALVLDGFNRGGFQYIDVTQAQQALNDARARRVEILRQFHLDQAALDRLTARHVALLSETRP